MARAKPSGLGNAAQNKLLGDLESIRTLLELPESPLDDNADVPMLQDVVESALVVNESLLTSRATIDDADAGGHSALDDATIRELLGDEWRSAAQRILAEARAAVANGSHEPSALNDALMAQFDRTLDEWLIDLIRTRIDDLRARLLGALEREVAQFTAPRREPEDHGY